MAVPTNAMLNRTFPHKSGVMLGMSPSSDPTFDIEMARATSSGVYVTIARLTPKGSGIPVSFTDILPVDNTRRSYKARAVKDGWDPGDYTAVVSAKPIILPEISPNVTPLTGQKIGANLYLSTAQSLAYGTPAVAQSYKKTVRAGGTAFVPGSSGVSFSYGIGTLIPTTKNVSTQANYVAHVELPENVTVYKARWIYSRTSANAVFRAELYSVSTAGTATLRYGKTSTSVSAATQVLSSSSFSFSVASRYVISRVAMKSTGAGGNRSAIVALEIGYQTPAAQTAI